MAFGVLGFAQPVFAGVDDEAAAPAAAGHADEFEPSPEELAEGKKEVARDNAAWGFYDLLKAHILCPSPLSVKNMVPRPEVAVAELGPIFRGLRKIPTSIIRGWVWDMDALATSDEYALDLINNVGIDETLSAKPKFLDMMRALDKIRRASAVARDVCSQQADAKAHFMKDYLKLPRQNEKPSDKNDHKGCSEVNANKILKQWNDGWAEYRQAFKAVYATYNAKTRSENCKANKVTHKVYEDNEKEARTTLDESKVTVESAASAARAKKVDDRVAEISAKSDDPKNAAWKKELETRFKINLDDHSEVRKKLEDDPAFVKATKELPKSTAADTSPAPIVPTAEPAAPAVEAPQVAPPEPAPAPIPPAAPAPAATWSKRPSTSAESPAAQLAKSTGRPLSLAEKDDVGRAMFFYNRAKDPKNTTSRVDLENRFKVDFSDPMAIFKALRASPDFEKAVAESIY